MSTDTGTAVDQAPSPSLTRHHTRAHWVPLTLAAALATLLALGGTAWLAGRAGSGAGPAPSDDGDGPQRVAVVAYGVADTAVGARLVADRRVVPDLSSSLRTAVVETLGGTPVAGDVAPAWPDAPEMDVEVAVEGDLVSVDLRPEDPDDLAAGDPSPLLGQALAWTVASALDDPYVVVEVLVDGEPPGDLLPGVGGPHKPARSPDVLVPVTVESVNDGDTVSGPVPVSGRAATVEGTVAWSLLREDGTVVEEGFATADECCVHAPYDFLLDPPPGDYRLRLAETDPSGGEGYPAYRRDVPLTVE